MIAIELVQVTLVHGGRIVLSDVNISIRRGEFVGVFGPNGGGKTTLIHAILGLLRPSTGEISVLGARPARGNPEAGYLPQHRTSVADLGLRGRDFVASALRGQRWGLWRSGAGEGEVKDAIATVEAEHLADRPLSGLSGGERQRLFLAQALLGQPKLLLLDEPLLGLDPRFQRATVDLVKRIQRDRRITVLFTAHEVNPLLDHIDRVLYLGQRRAALGTVDEVITDGVLSRLYGMPIEVLRRNGRILVASGYATVDAEVHR